MYQTKQFEKNKVVLFGKRCPRSVTELGDTLLKGLIHLTAGNMCKF